MDGGRLLGCVLARVVLAAACGCCAVAAGGGEPAAPGAPPPAVADPPRKWTGRKGGEIVGRFVRVAGGALVIESEGREIRVSLELLSDESARLARELAGLGGAAAPGRVVAPPPRLVFVPVKADRFEMGSPPEEPGHEEDEPRHRVWLRTDFLMKRTEVTWAEWEAVRKFAADRGYSDLGQGSNGHHADGEKGHPVVGVSWWDAIKWCNLLSELEGRKAVYYSNPNFDPAFVVNSGTPAKVHVQWNADGYRLPTEAEWEFACRPGLSKRAFHSGPVRPVGSEPLDRNLDAAGWYAGNSGGGTHPVAAKQPNELGLHDMHGNAAEWCWDHYGPLGSGEAFDPRGPAAGDRRVIRGGSWNDPAADCRAAARFGCTPKFAPNHTVGFRPVRSVKHLGRR